MKFPLVKRSALDALQRKLDEARAKLRKKDEQIKKAKAREKKTVAVAQERRQAIETLHKELAEVSTRAPQAVLDAIAYSCGREILSLRFLRGKGLEVGALHRPTRTMPGTVTKYYDCTTAEECGRRFPHLLKQGHQMVEVDYVGDGEKLDLVPDDSLDYLIANHMLEHCQDVIATLKVFWRKLRKGGALLIALPDKRYTFDYRRPLTPFEHLVQDYEQGPRTSLYQHYQEFHQLATPDPTAALAKTEEEVLAMMSHVDLHFHVWTQADILEMFLRLGKEHGFHWEIEGTLRQANEFITVLRKEDVQLWDRNRPETAK